MKYIAWFVGVVVALIGALYLVVFTSFGNSLLSPIIEKKIQEQTKLQSKLTTFSLSMSDFEILLELNRNNTILLKGNYSLFLQSFNIAYRVSLAELQTLQPLTQMQLRSSFATEGSVVGDMKFIRVDGKSDIAKSNTSYRVELKDFDLTSIVATIENADLKSLLYMTGQKEYASATINLDLDFKNIEPKELDGNIELTTTNGRLNADVMKRDFNVTIPNTAFDMNLEALLAKESVEYTYRLDSNLANLSSSGIVTPQPLALDVKYGVNIKELAVLKPMTNADLRGPLNISGVAKGTKESLIVNGKSDIAKSATTYKVALSDFNPTSIIAKVQNADLESLLYMVGEKKYASAAIDLDMNFKNIKPHELDGSVLLVSKNGLLNSAVMKKDFNITIPKTAFSMNLEAILKGESADYKYLLTSNLAKISSSGKVTPEPLALDIKYGVDIEELAVLKPITNADVRGALRLSGAAKGGKERLTVDGRSDLAGSETKFSALLEEFAPKSADLSIKNMRLEKALYMVNQPHYTDGIFSLDAKISDANPDTLAGVITTDIKEGLLDSKFLTQEFEFKSLMPTTRYAMQTKTEIKNSLAKTELSFASTLADFDIKEANFHLKSGAVESDYIVRLHDLNKLMFVTERPLKGSISVHGELKKDKDLDFSAYSDIAGGKLVANLHNDDFKANLKSMQTLELLDMLIYPKIFKSSIDGDVTYNLAEKKGLFKGELKDGKFTQNEVLDLAKRYANTDLYIETFLGNVDAVIRQENIVASLMLNSNKSHIKTKDTKLNTKTKNIDSKIEINANGNPLTVTLKGDVNAPKVGVDASKIIEKEAKQAIEKEVNKFLQKEGGKELEEEAKKLLKGFF